MHTDDDTRPRRTPVTAARWRRAARDGSGIAWIAALLLCLPLPAGGQRVDVAIPPGINFGGSVGLNHFRAPEHAPIESAVGWEFFVGGGLGNGLFTRIGGMTSGHTVAPNTPDWEFLTFFVEPRYVMLNVFPAVAPFVGGRIGWAREKVSGRAYALEARGTVLAASSGIILRVAPQIAVEAGLMFGSTRFDDYVYQGAEAWKLCLDHLEAGTSMPASVASCTGSRSFGGVVRLCYPPYFSGDETGDCEPPDIPYEGTGRSGSWLRGWIGVNLSVSTILHR